jgi:hypothetical protein
MDPQFKPALTSPSRLELTVLYFLLGAHVVLASDTAIPSGWVMFASASLFVAALWFAVRIGFAAWGFRVIQPSVMRWAEGTLILAAFIILHTTQLGVAARVYLSEKRLMEQVHLAQGMKREWHGGSGIPCRLFTVQAVIPHNDQTVWLETVSGSRLFQPHDSMWGGVAYCEQGHPPPFGEIYYRHLYGPWWSWLQDI